MSYIPTIILLIAIAYGAIAGIYALVYSFYKAVIKGEAPPVAGARRYRHQDSAGVDVSGE